MNTLIAISTIVAICAVVALIIVGRRNYFRKIAEKCDPVLMQLNANGDNHSQVRTVDHWIYFNSKPDMDRFVCKVKKVGFRVLSTGANDATVYNLAVNICRDESVERKNMIRTVGKPQAIATKCGGCYDGWGCPVQN